jgi:hypothetical protein
MTVQELIEELKQYLPNMTILLYNHCADDGSTWTEPCVETPNYGMMTRIHNLPEEQLVELR